ncbi:MAG: glycerol-3-phosphate acyltransferase [Clostridia bacterium]|nr:glycerol-3-phosphate acyltransferase [Clostridia bacterium]
MKFLCCILIGYLIGSINPSYFIAKSKGFDIRTKGSRNAGASNVLILLGKLSGVMCAIIDIAKAYLAILLTATMFPGYEYAFSVTAVFCVIGHVFPFYMSFKGGKGLACLGGIILYYNWKVFLIMLFSATVLALLTDYICFVPLSASVVFPFVYGILEKNIVGAIMLAAITAIMLVKHIENLKRIGAGTEMRLSYLWKPEAEIERMKNNISADEQTFSDNFLTK